MPALVLHGTESVQTADFNSCLAALLMGIWRNPRRFALAHGEPQSLLKDTALRLSFRTLYSAQLRSLDTGRIDIDMTLEDHQQQQ